MRYYKLIANGALIAIGTGLGGIEITEEEYNAFLSEIQEKADLEDQLYNGRITADSVPIEWREEIQHRVDEHMAAEAEKQNEEVSGEELLAMIEEVL